MKQMKRIGLLLLVTVFTSVMAVAQTPYVVWCESDSALYFTNRSETLSVNGLFTPEGSSEAKTITDLWSGNQVTATASMPEWYEYNKNSVSTVVIESSFNNVKPQKMTFWFGYKLSSSQSNLTTIKGLNNLNTENVTDMAFAFSRCRKLKELDLSNFNTSKVKTMRFMFDGCSALANIDLSHFNTNNVTDMGYMFYGCSGLTSIDLSHFNTDNVTDMGSMFYGCSSLTSVDLSHFNTDNVTDMGSMFFGCSSLTSVDLSEFGTGNVTDMSGMFSDCSGLNSLDVSNFDTSNVTDMSGMFHNCSGLSSLDVSHFVTNNVTYMSSLFSGCRSLNSIDVSHFVTNNVTNMDNMFSGCSGLANIDVSNFDTRNVTDMRSMFNDCSGLTSIDVSHFDTSNVTDLSGMFSECSVLTCLDVTHFDTGNVMNMSGMFNGCSGLTSIDLSHFDTDNVTDFSGMFWRCNTLTSLDLSHFKTDNVTNLREMFAYCNGLTSLDLSNFNTGKVMDVNRMFLGCTSLTTVLVSEKWTTESVTEGETTFLDCPKLVGGNGTKYDEAHADYDYAHIDEEGNPGYLTRAIPTQVSFIVFADAEVKRICVENWDTNGDQELSQSEAAAVKDIGAVFKGNRTIKSFEELEHFTGITTIPEQAFFGCCELETVTIPNQVKGIGNNAFSSTKLKSIYIPASVTEQISHTPFYDCPELASIIVDEDNPTFDSRDNCNAIIETATNKLIAGCKKTVIPNGVTTIAQHALACATGLTQIDIPQSVTTIEYEAFSATGLESIVIPSSVSNLDVNNGNAFRGCANLKSIVVEADNPWFDSRNDCNAIIETSTNKLVSGCQNTIIPETVTCIGNAAFEYIEQLKSIHLPSQLSTIERRAFCKTSITMVDIPQSVSSIGRDAFLWCFNLHSVVVHRAEPIAITEDVFPDRAYATLYVPVGSKAAYEAADYWKDFQKIVEKDEEATPNSPIVFADAEVKRICIENWDTNKDGELSFGEAAAVTDLDGKFTANETIVTFDELQYFTGLTSMGYDFGHCYELQSVIVPKNVTSMGAHTFKWCMKLSHLELPEALVDIKDFALHGCKSLTEITIPKNVRYIRDWAFQNCSSITSLEIPEKVELVGTYIVSACPLLTTLTVNSANPYYDSRDNCNAIIHTESNTLVASCQTTTIPSSVKAIGDYAFCFCMGLKQIDIPSGVESIGVNAFKDAEFSSIDIPASVTSIGDEAFFCCNSLTSVTVRMEQPIAITENTFSNRANATLYVPFGCKEAYEKADYWKEFKEIVEMGISPLYEDDNVDFSDTDNEINEETDLTDTVVNNLYYSIGTDAGGYNAEDGCIVITKETSEEQMTALEGLGISDEELKQNFTGIIFKVPGGRGYVTVTAETTGNMTLKVQVGNGMPMEMVLSGKLTMKVPYNVEEETMVYVFAGTTGQSAARGLLRGGTDQSLKIYGIELETTVIKGDANEDKKVNVADVNEVANAIIGKPSDKYNKTIADMNNDGNVDVTDLTRIVKIAKSRR